MRLAVRFASRTLRAVPLRLGHRSLSSGCLTFINRAIAQLRRAARPYSGRLPLFLKLVVSLGKRLIAAEVWSNAFANVVVSS